MDFVNTIALIVSKSMFDPADGTDSCLLRFVAFTLVDEMIQGMTMSDDSLIHSESNPYAPPIMMRAEVNPFHAELFLSDQGIITRTGLVLPETCLTTGKTITGNAVALRFELSNPTSFNKRIQRYSFWSFVVLPILLLSTLGAGRKLVPQIFAIIDLRWMTLTACLAALCGCTWAITGWMAERVRIIGHTSRRRYRWMVLMRVFSIVLAVSIVLPVPLPANDLIRVILFIALLFFMCVVRPVLYRTVFAGMNFRVRPATDNHVEVTGFTPAFLAALRLHDQE